MILVLVLAIHNMIWHIKILHNLTGHDSIWHNVMILVSIQQHNMIWHIKILHNAQVSQSLEQKSDSFTDKSFRAHTRRTMHTTIGEGDETRLHICHIYHRLHLWRKFQISVKNLNNLWRFIENYAAFVVNLCGEKKTNMRSGWNTHWRTHTTVEHSHKECNTMHKKVQSHNRTRGWDYSHTRDWGEHLYKLTKGSKGVESKEAVRQLAKENWGR